AVPHRRLPSSRASKPGSGSMAPRLGRGWPSDSSDCLNCLTDETNEKPTMGHSDLHAAVASALGRIQNPRLGNDLLSAGMIRDLSVTDDGRVAFTFLLSRQDPATLVREARKALQAIEGITDVKIKVVDPAGPAPV